MNSPSATGPYGSGYWGYPWRTVSWSVGHIRKVEFGWPLGMPYCRSLGNGCGLHSFVEKTRKTPARDLRLALKRMQEVLCDDA
jgi:hypothetical protein